IHDRFGGQRQYGISTPQGQPYIFLFSGATGSRHGYFDYYDEDGVFHYFGEGQKGDMRMERGNLAIRDHLRTGRRLLVFKSLGGGRQRFVGEFVYEDHDVDRKSTRLNSSHVKISYAVFCLKKKTNI